ncbi:MAG: peptidase T [Clostridium sp.]|nr:peptidase T [Clostridium sp.]
MKENIIERFFSYVKVDTTSDESKDVVPSTSGQYKLAGILKLELEKLGLETSLDDKGYLFGKLKSNTDKKLKKLGFLAHLDTSPDMSGKNVNPRIVKYIGEDIILNKEKGIVLSEKDFPNLRNYIGEELIVTDGTTLLGADDKAGIAEIMVALEHLHKNQDIVHGDIHVAFTPDEEIGRGPHNFDVEKFGADVAYTVDGGPLGELQYENFNAASADVKIKGRNVHPGTAKDQMINSIRIATEFESLLDQNERPEKTEGYEGFIHLNDFVGNVEETKLSYIIRDFDRADFESKKEKMLENTNKLNKKYGEDTVDIKIENQYKNMKKMIEPHMYLIDYAIKAMEMADVKPVIEPIRGGTDGAQLSYMGLPCPNIFTGGENYHGRYEFISIKSMEKSVEVILNLIDIFSKE